jgi:hypothetical protein
LGFSSTRREKGFTFSAISAARSQRPYRGDSSFPTCHLPWGFSRSPGLLVSDLAALGLGREDGAAAVSLAEAEETRVAVGSLEARFRTVPDASIRGRLESTRGVGPRLSLVAMAPAARDLKESLEI